MKNKIEDLRNHLFAQLERLSDENLTEAQIEKETNRAASMVQVAEIIIETGRVENEFLEITGGTGNESSGFFPIAKDQRKYFIEKD